MTGAASAACTTGSGFGCVAQAVSVIIKDDISRVVLLSILASLIVLSHVDNKAGSLSLRKHFT